MGMMTVFWEPNCWAISCRPRFPASLTWATVLCQRLNKCTRTFGSGRIRPEPDISIDVLDLSPNKEKKRCNLRAYLRNSQSGTNTINTCMHQNMKFMKHNPKSQRCTCFLIATQMWWQRSHGSYGYLVFLHWILLAASGHVQSATKFPSTACPLGVLWRSMRMAAFISPSLPNAQQPELWRHQFVRLRSMD